MVQPRLILIVIHLTADREMLTKYACLTCRKVFKKNRLGAKDGRTRTTLSYQVTCPQCQAEMYRAGSAFKAPKHTDVKKWALLTQLFLQGHVFEPDSGNPFLESKKVQRAKPNVPASEFRKPARKRRRDV